MRVAQIRVRRQDEDGWSGHQGSVPPNSLGNHLVRGREFIEFSVISENWIA
jgi:hypothetical protein